MKISKKNIREIQHHYSEAHENSVRVYYTDRSFVGVGLTRLDSHTIRVGIEVFGKEFHDKGYPIFTIDKTQVCRNMTEAKKFLGRNWLAKLLYHQLENPWRYREAWFKRQILDGEWKAMPTRAEVTGRDWYECGTMYLEGLFSRTYHLLPLETTIKVTFSHPFRYIPRKPESLELDTDELIIEGYFSGCYTGKASDLRPWFCGVDGFAELPESDLRAWLGNATRLS